MTNIKEIIKKYEEFSTYLDSIDFNELTANLTRQQLLELEEALSSVELRSLSYEVRKLADKKKLEEYPQLLGVHHYPEINEIDFLSEKKKIELDKYLAMMFKGSYVFNLWKFTNETERLQKTLVEKGIFEEVYFITCPYHKKEKLTKIDLEKLNELKKAKENNDIEMLETFFEELNYCDNCDDHVQHSEWEIDCIIKEYILARDRDKSLDNI